MCSIKRVCGAFISPFQFKFSGGLNLILSILIMVRIPGYYTEERGLFPYREIIEIR